MLNRIRESRKEAGYTQEEFSEMLGCSQVTLSTWERGVREPKFETLIQIADICKCSLDYLLYRTDEVNGIWKPSTKEEILQDKAKAKTAFTDLKHVQVPQTNQFSEVLQQLIQTEIQKALDARR